MLTRLSELTRRIRWFGLLSLILQAGLVLTVCAAVTVSNYLPQALFHGQYVERWSDSTRVIQITMVPPKNIPGWRPGVTTLVQRAFNEWQTVLQGRIRFAYTYDPTKTDVTVRWRNQSKGMEIGNQSFRSTDKIFTDMDLEIAMNDPHGHAFSDAALYYIALHEIGHLLGIKGHSTDPRDIMYASIQPNVPRLSARDIATVRALYQQPANITNPPGIHLMAYREYEYYSNLGNSAFQSKNFQDALEYYGKALRYFPSDKDTIYRVGTSAYNLHMWDVAAANLQVVASTPSRYRNDAQFYLGNALMAAGATAIKNGDKNGGLQKLAAAKRQFDLVQQQPQSSMVQKQQAALCVAQIGKIYSQFH